MKVDKDNVKRILMLALIMLVLLILDNSFMPFFSIRGSYGSLLFTFSIAYSIIKGRKEAVYIGIASGFLQDIYFCNGLGVNTFSNMWICYLAAIIGEKIYVEKKLVPVFATMVLTVLKVVIISVIFKVVGFRLDVNISLNSSMYNSVILFLGYDFILKIFHNEQSRNSWRFK